MKDHFKPSKPFYKNKSTWIKIKYKLICEYMNLYKFEFQLNILSLCVNKFLKYYLDSEEIKLQIE